MIVNDFSKDIADLKKTSGIYSRGNQTRVELVTGPLSDLRQFLATVSLL